MANEENSLFAPVQEGLKSLAVPAKEGKISWLTGSPARIVGLVVLVTILFITIVYYRIVGVSSTMSSVERSSTRVVSNFGATSGIVEINDTDWCAPIVSLSTKTRIDVKILTNDVWWRARLDGDDRRIVELYPGNWVSDKHVEVGEFNSIELCLKPNQSVRTAKIAWMISPKKTGS